MRIEFSDLDEKNVFDICIIGSGPAGVTCALELAADGKNVVLLEGGEKEYTEQSQMVYEGTTTGDPYHRLDVTRLRYFGGSSNHWEGVCRPLDDRDFDVRKEFDTGWPISKRDVDPYLKRASSILEIDEFKEDVPIADSGLVMFEFQNSPPVNFLDKYFEQITSHRNIKLLLGANVTSIATNGKRITDVNIESFYGDQASVKAKVFILATGGIENSRLLLWSNYLSNGAVIKNDTSLGCYWMDHPDFTIGSAIIETEKFQGTKNESSLFLAPTKKTMIKNTILNCGLRLDKGNYSGTKKMIADIACVAPVLGHNFFDLLNFNLVCGFKLRASWEQEPTRANCITLDNEKDKLGIPRTKLHWEMSKTDFQTAKKTATILGNYLAENDIGRVMISSWLLDEKEYPEGDQITGHHHMGGTRMANNAQHGIVDANCKVFGQDNLYIAGSSVFRSGGFANPTLTIIQLSLRLSDHLKSFN